MIALVLLVAGVGLGLWAVAVWLVPPRPGLEALLTRLHQAEPEPTPSADAGQGGWAQHLGRPFVALLRGAGLPTPGLRRDLAVVERPVEVHLAEKAALAVVGLLLPAAVGLLLALGGRRLPWPLPAGVCVVLAVGGFVLPDATVRTAAARRRADFRHALSAYLDLVTLMLAAGAGVEAALHDAAGIGHGWAFDRLRRALELARLTRTSPWHTLAELGEELDVRELAELAAALSLAGTEGAKVRASLAAKAIALRHRGATEAEAAANAATERMALPGVVMAIGFIVFVFYPALSEVTTSL